MGFKEISGEFSVLSLKYNTCQPFNISYNTKQICRKVLIFSKNCKSNFYYCKAGESEGERERDRLIWAWREILCRSHNKLELTPERTPQSLSLSYLITLTTTLPPNIHWWKLHRVNLIKEMNIHTLQ